MICPHCGKKNPNDAVFCSSCNGWVFGCGEEELISVQKESPAPIAESAQETPVRKRRRWPIFCAVGAVAVVIAVCILLLLLKQQDNYIKCSHEVFTTKIGETVIFIYDDQLVRTSLAPRFLTASAQSLDGSATVILTDTAHLLLVRNGVATVISDNVEDYTMSLSGNTVAYCHTSEGETSLCLYDADIGSTQIIERVAYQSYSNLRLSPDGTKLTYFMQHENGLLAQLVLFNGSEAATLATVNTDIHLLAISNDGLVYTADASELILYSEEGARSTLGTYMGNMAGAFHFNADQSQLLFYTNEGSFISTDGGTPVQISEDVVCPIIPNGTQAVELCHKYGYGYTHPLAELYGNTFASRKYPIFSNFLDSYVEPYYNLYYIDKNPQSSRSLAENVESFSLNPGSDDVFCLLSNHSLVRISGYGQEATTLAEAVSKFAVTTDGSMVYYISDGDLYSCHGQTGKSKTLIHDNGCKSLYISREDVAYYTALDSVYCCADGKNGQQLLYSCDSIRYSSSGIVYVLHGDHVSVSTADGQLKKIT